MHLLTPSRTVDMRLELPARPKATVALTPLIDVVFILLLFFMLTTQFSRQQALPMTLPASEVPLADQSPDTLLIELAADGTVSLLGETGISASVVVDHPAIQQAIDRATPVFIVADDAVQLQTFTQVMDALSAHGITNLSVKGLR